MAKQTQSYRLFQLLSTGSLVSKEQIAKELDVSLASVPVYIHELKKTFKVEVTSVREGRKILGYKVADTNKAKVPQFRKNNAEYVKPEEPKKVVISDDGEVPVLDADAEITRVSDREFSDIRESLGVSSFGGFSD